MLREPAMWMSTTPTKERLPAIRGTAHGRHTDLGCAPLFWHKARDLCLKRRTIKSLSLRFWLSSSRSLGRCLLLGQRNPMNLHTVRPYIHHTSLSRDGKSSKTSPFVLSTVEGLRRSFSRIMLRRPGLV